MITVVGSANMDLIARVPHLPHHGETVLAAGFARLPGGKGANQAVAAARAGSQVTVVGRVGRDAYGAELADNLRRAGVDTDALVADPHAPTGLALITVDEEGENHIVVVPGANGHVTQDDVDTVRDLIAASDIVILQLEIPLESVAHAARLAREGGAKVILNPSPAQPLDPDLLELVDVLVPNRKEVGRVSGLGDLDPAAAARLLLDTGVGAVVVTLGAQGAVIVTRDREIDVPAFPARPVDTTGAGDAFVGNLAHALEQGESLQDAVRFAAAAAALSVQKQGAQPSMPSLTETETYLKRAPLP
jgi:ribokinase